jgi:hypothetical protein
VEEKQAIIETVLQRTGEKITLNQLRNIIDYLVKKNRKRKRTDPQINHPDESALIGQPDALIAGIEHRKSDHRRPLSYSFSSVSIS